MSSIALILSLIAVALVCKVLYKVGKVLHKGYCLACKFRDGCYH